MSRLSSTGKWMRNHGRSIYGYTRAPGKFRIRENCRLTYNPETNWLYSHLMIGLRLFSGSGSEGLDG